MFLIQPRNNFFYLNHKILNDFSFKIPGNQNVTFEPLIFIFNQTFHFPPYSLPIKRKITVLYHVQNLQCFVFLQQQNNSGRPSKTFTQFIPIDSINKSETKIIIKTTKMNQNLN